MYPNVLTIAGSDPTGGAGIQADLKTFAALGCYGLSAVTALTVQNTQGVYAVHLPPADFVAKQIERLFADCAIAAVKIGMLASAPIAMAVADVLARHKPGFVVLDPVRAASTGGALSSDDLAPILTEYLAPVTSLITPNLAEAAWLCGALPATSVEDMKVMAHDLHRIGFRAVLVKGGHLAGAESKDVLFDGEKFASFSSERIATRNTHGTGCTLSSAIAACLAHGRDLFEAVEAAKRFVTGALAAADELDVGAGPGPLHHFHARP
jgi:hydroxymethylpyrimidine kinase/phosphomethylpyrimidine kinase